MALESLQSFRWEQGTLASPVPLTKAEFTGLVNLILNGEVEKDIRGYIRPLNVISSYEDYVVKTNCPQLTLVDAEITPVEYNVFLDSDSVNEGNRVKINVTGIGFSALKFRITSHTVQTPELQDRTTIDTANGYVVVAPAQENATWDDLITFQTCPVWEEWSDPNASIKNINITVHAVAVSSVTLTAPSIVAPTKTFYPTVNFLPAGNTKPKVTSRSDAANGLYFEASSDDFTVVKRDANTIIAIAPSIESSTGQPYILRCNVYAFTLDNVFAALLANIQCKYPYIQFTVTTDGTFSDISTANPKITLHKVNSQDTPIGEPVVLTGTVSGSSLVYTYGEGNVAGDGSETYKVTFDEAPEGYKNIQQMTITPNQVITEVAVQYVVKRPDIYQVYADGDYEPISAVQERGSLKAKVPIGLAFVTEETSFMLKADSTNETQDFNGKYLARQNVAQTIDGYTRTITTIKSVAAMDFNGETNTEVFKRDIIQNGENADNYFFGYARSRTITINNVSYNGYVPAAGQMLLLRQNATLIANYTQTYYGTRREFPATDCAVSTGYDTTKVYNVYGLGTTTDRWATSNNGGKRPAIIVYPFNM